MNQKLALRLLERMGYNADLASNGREAIAAVEAAVYDVVLMDVQMPEVDGLEATRHIRRRWPGTAGPRIVAMTANAMEGDREACLAAGMDEYLSKPIRPETLAAALSATDRRDAVPTTEPAREAASYGGARDRGRPGPRRRRHAIQPAPAGAPAGDHRSRLIGSVRRARSAGHAARPRRATDRRRSPRHRHAGDGRLRDRRPQGRQVCVDLPVIVISGVDELDSVVRCIGLGATDYLPNTVDPAILRARIEASLAQKRLRDLEARDARTADGHQRRAADHEPLGVRAPGRT